MFKLFLSVAIFRHPLPNHQCIQCVFCVTCFQPFLEFILKQFHCKYIAIHYALEQ
jgi:hypothetical protein